MEQETIRGIQNLRFSNISYWTASVHKLFVGIPVKLINTMNKRLSVIILVFTYSDCSPDSGASFIAFQLVVCPVILSNIFSLILWKFSLFAWLFFWCLQITNYYTYFFYKQPVYKSPALGWQIGKQLSGLSPLSLSNNKS